MIQSEGQRVIDCLHPFFFTATRYQFRFGCRHYSNFDHSLDYHYHQHYYSFCNLQPRAAENIYNINCICIYTIYAQHAYVYSYKSNSEIVTFHVYDRSTSSDGASVAEWATALLSWHIRYWHHAAAVRVRSWDVAWATCVKVSSVTCRMSVVSFGYSGSLYQWIETIFHHHRFTAYIMTPGCCWGVKP